MRQEITPRGGSDVDVGQRRQVEEALRASEARLAAELTMMGRLHDLSNRLLRAPDLPAALEEVLDAALAVCGTDLGSVQLLNERSRALEIAAQRGFGQDFLEHFREVSIGDESACARAMQQGERTVIEDVETDAGFAPHRGIAAAAGFRAVQSTPMRSHDGTLLGMLSTHFREPRRLSESELRVLDLCARHAADFIERFRIEQALRESEGRLRLALRGANAGVWRFEVASGDTFWSEEFEPLYGFDATTPRSYETWLARVHPEDRARVRADFRARIKSRETEFQYELRILHPQHGVRWILDLGRVERDGDGRAVRLSGINLDITERRQAEEALRNSERLYRAIGESIDYGVWVCDPEGRNLYASESFLRLVGQTEEECAAFGWGNVLHPEDAERTLAAWKECVRSGGEWDIEHRFRGVDGKWHPILARGVPVRNERGEITAWAGINLDIGRLKQVEEELRAADRRKDEFLAALAHELRNPLAPLRNGVEIMRLAGDNREALGQARGMMERQLTHLVRLVDDLLDLSRITRGRIELRRERVDLAVAVRHAIETSRPVIEQAAHELSVRMPPGPLFVEVDTIRLAQAIANLLHNAARYTEPGGHIRLALAQRGSRAELSVQDNGAGIPPSQLPHVFEMFARVDRPPGRAQGGLGIGLSIVKHLVDMHGGTVEARSPGEGAGSEFLIRLPLVEAPHASGTPAAQEHASAARARRRVLVADDNADAAASLAALLDMLGNDVRTARDGREAVELAAAFRPELVLLDIGMPVMDGCEACRHIREQASGRGMVIAALTGWGRDGDRQRSRAAGFDQHLVKPVDPGILERLLAAMPG